MQGGRCATALGAFHCYFEAWVANERQCQEYCTSLEEGCIAYTHRDAGGSQPCWVYPVQGCVPSQPGVFSAGDAHLGPWSKQKESHLNLIRCDSAHGTSSENKTKVRVQGHLHHPRSGDTRSLSVHEAVER
jgi:hypothetical protein